MIFIVISCSCSNNRGHAGKDDYSNINEMSDSVCSLTLMIEEVYGRAVIMNGDTILGYYAQVIQCNESAIMYGWTIEDTGNVIDNRCIIWQSYYPKDKNRGIIIRALNEEEHQFVKNATTSLANTHYEYPHNINDATKFKLYVNNKKIADGYLVDFKALPLKLKNVINHIIDMIGPLSTIDGHDIRQLMNDDLSYSYDS